jgi:hypothetical protein
MQEVKQILSLATDALGDDPALLQYQQGIQEIAASVVRWGYVTEEQIGTLRELYDELERQKDLNAPQVAADAAAEAARKTEEERQANITDQGTQIKGSLQQQAIGVASTVGIEEALSALKEQKALVDSAIDELIKSGVSDPDEIALRLAGLNDQIVQFFDNIKAEATDFSFDGIDQAFANIFTDLNFGDIDFLPGLEQLRDDAISLFEEIQQAGGTVTEEQAAMLDYYSAAASAAADESSALGGIVNELGSEFIANNELVGELISQMYLTQAAFGAGQIGADTFAGRMAALGGQLLAYITQAGVATDATYALINAQAGLKGTAGYTLGFGTGNAIGAGIKAREESRQREQARREAEQAAKAAAREQERAAKAAARELEQGAKKAAQELQSALKGVPGLFGRSAITQKDFDLTKAGVYQDQADEKLRRLQAEVEQGKDLFSDISIEDAKQSLRDLGVQVAEDNKVAFEQFADAWESGLLFFDADNIAKYIDAEAVQRSLDLQAKAKEGQENIFKAFGATVDDAVAAVGTGLTSAGAVASPSGGYTIPIKAELTPMTPTEAQTIPTLGGISPVIDIAAIQGQLAETPFEIQITLGADGVSNFANEFMAQLGNTDKFIGIGDSIKAAIAQEIGTTKFTDAGIMTPIADGLIRAINTEFSIKSKNIGAQGNSVGENLKASIASNLGTTEWKDGQAVTPIANGLLASIGTQIRASGDKIKGIAAGFSDSLKGEIASAIGTTQWQDGEILAPIANGLLAGINTQIRGSGDQISSFGTNVANTLTGSVANGLAAQEDAAIATAMVSALNSQFTTAQNMFYAVGQIPAQNVLGGYVGFFSTGYSEGSGTPLVTPMVTAINTQIRANTEALRGQGATMASYVINGFAGSFSNETFKNTIIAAGDLMGSYLEIGILSRIRGGALVEAIGAQVLADIADTVEEPTP